MSRLPRLLPLLGVAIGGVLAANALQGARSLPEFFSSAQASAEEAAKAGPAKSAPAAAKPGPIPTPRPVSPPAAKMPAVCAPTPADLARSAGLSPAELNILQNLQARRGQIESREKDLDTEVQLLGAAEAKVDGKLKALNTLKAEIQGLMAQADQKSQKDIDNLVIVYTKMKPSEAAAVMAQLDDRVRLPIAAAMKPATLSAILGKMSPTEAKVLTERLAHRFAPLQAAADAARAPASGPGARSPPKAGEDVADADADDAAPAAKVKTRAKPVRRVRRKPPDLAALAAGEDRLVKTQAPAQAATPTREKAS